MKDDTSANLKQFIASAISQQTSDLREDIVAVKDGLAAIKDEIQVVHQKIDDLSESVDKFLCQ